jgi:hypothetical protein
MARKSKGTEKRGADYSLARPERVHRAPVPSDRDYLLDLARWNSDLISTAVANTLLAAYDQWRRFQTPTMEQAFEKALKAAERSVNRRSAPTVRRSRKHRSQQVPVRTPTQLTWSVLPPGQRIVDHVARQSSARAWEGRSWDHERLALLDSLKPTAWYRGAHLGHTIYFVAVFDRVAIADTPEWGNALYYCPTDCGRWQDVFRLDKQAAVAAGARRLIHATGFEPHVRRLVQQEESLTASTGPC